MKSKATCMSASRVPSTSIDPNTVLREGVFHVTNPQHVLQPRVDHIPGPGFQKKPRRRRSRKPDPRTLLTKPYIHRPQPVIGRIKALMTDDLRALLWARLGPRPVKKMSFNTLVKKFASAAELTPPTITRFLDGLTSNLLTITKIGNELGYEIYWRMDLRKIQTTSWQEIRSRSGLGDKQ
jgi:hypothetical protein